MSINPNSESAGTLERDNLSAGGFPVAVVDGVIISGQELVRGALLGRDADGKWKLSLAAAEDGSEVPRGILLTDIDASGGDVAGAPIARTGDFNERALTVGAGHVIADLREALADLNLFIRATVSA